MKHSFIALALVGMIAASCKKDHTCNCTITTDGTTTTHSQTESIALNIPVTIPLPIPGFTIVPGRDTTTYTPFHTVNTLEKNYHNVSMSTMRDNCITSSDETLNNSSTSSVPGIYTITTTNSGLKTSACQIE